MSVCGLTTLARLGDAVTITLGADLHNVEVRVASERGYAPDLIVRLEEWPGGLRCGQCHRRMRDGEPYAESLTSMAGGIPVVMIVCRPCDEGQHTIITD
jgi:hypothetical protein